MTNQSINETFVHLHSVTYPIIGKQCFDEFYIDSLKMGDNDLMNSIIMGENGVILSKRLICLNC